MVAEIEINPVVMDINRSSDSALANIDSGPGNLPFQLQNGEKILRQLKPQFFGFILTKTLGSYIALAILVGAVLAFYLELRVAFLGFLVQSNIIFGLPVLAILLPILIIAIALKPLIIYGKFKYWITNHRVIGKRGFLGYSIDSIPLENVADVVITRSLMDRILGLSSLIIVPMSGGGSTDGRENGGSPDDKTQNPDFFPALTYKSAMDLQRLLFNLRDERKNPQPVGAQIAKQVQPSESTSKSPGSNNRSNINI